MATGAETEQVQTIEEIEPFEAAEEIKGGDVVLIDTREPHEYQEAHLEGGKLVPPGLLGDEIAAAAPDKSARTILYCRSGNRSAIAAAQLQKLGYENVASMAGGILAWQEQGLPVVAAHGMTPEQRERYSRHTLLPEVGVDGQVKLLNAKVLLLGAGGLGAPTALYLAAAGVGTIGLVDDDVVDASNLQRQVIHNTERIGMPKTASARMFIEALNPDVKVVEHNGRLDASNILEIIGRLRHRRRRRRQLPHPLPAERRLGAAAQAGRLRLDPRLRRADLDLRPLRGPLLPLPLPDPAAGRAGAELLRQRGARRDGRDDGHAAGQRGDQAGARRRRAADRPPASLRGARHPLHRAQGPARPRVPDLRRERRARSRSRRWASSPTTTLFCAGLGGDR